MQTSYAHDQTKRAYKDFIRQFDALTDADVWCGVARILCAGDVETPFLGGEAP
jgi:hypothetical protein